jgi:hypothetical protein
MQPTPRRKRVRRGRLATTGTGLALAAIAVAALSSSSAAAPAEAPANTGEPAISGTPLEGQTLTTTTGTWTGTQPISFAYRWVRCGADGGKPDGSNCSTISGTTGKTYQLRRADVGFRLRVRVTGTNASGSATVASNPTTTVAARRPRNVDSPTITGSPTVGTTLQASTGTWTGEPPITFSYHWLRCNGSGASCSDIDGATASGYQARDRDVGSTLRVRVTARNSAGGRDATSAATGVVQASGPAGVITLPGGERSIPVTSVPKTERLIVAQVEFSPAPVRSARDPITVRIRVKDTRGFVVRDALVFIRATPRVTSTGDRQATAVDGWTTYQLVPNSNFPQPRSGYNVQFFLKAYRAGDPPLAGVAGYRLVQVAMAG